VRRLWFAINRNAKKNETMIGKKQESLRIKRIGKTSQKLTRIGIPS
jgi:hypothetical protein